MRPATKHNQFIGDVWEAVESMLGMFAGEVEPGEGEVLELLRARFARVVEELKLPESR